MFVIESCQKIEDNALFMMIFLPVSNFGDQPLALFLSKTFVWVFEIGRFRLFPSTLSSTFIPEAFVYAYINVA